MSSTNITNPIVGKLIVVTGPSGVGKGTLVRQLLQTHSQICLSVSVTTRSPRPGEIPGHDYDFVSRSEFQRMIAEGELLEWAEYAGNYYGTPKQKIKAQMAAGKIVLLEIELQGARQIRTNYPEAVQIFILPPSLAELEKRLRGRGSESESAIAQRLQRAEIEIQASSEFDQQIINADLAKALQELELAIFGDSSASQPVIQSLQSEEKVS